MSENNTVLYFKNTQVLQKVHRKIKFDWGIWLNFDSEICVLTDWSRVCYTHGEHKLFY